MQSRSLKYAGIAALLLAAAPREYASKSPLPAEYIRECPAGGDSAVAAIIGETAEMPEYNDCQRFILQKGGGFVFDSLYAIYAYHLQTASLASSGVAVLVALIQSFGGRYDTLGIQPGYSCLYMHRQKLASGATVLRATMIAKTSRLRCPDRALPAWLRLMRGKPLEVRRQMVLRTADSLYPPVARWDWDPVRNEQYIGLKCQAAWCEIGRQGFRSSSRWVPDPAMQGKHVMLVKGWYDEQFLAGAGPVGTLPPVSGIKATTFPDPSLGAYVESSFNGTWLPVAHVALSNTLSKYVTAFNLTRTPAAFTGAPVRLSSLNSIELCMGTSTACAVPAPLPTCDSYAALAWGWARIGSPAGVGPVTYKYRCVPRWDHTDGLNPIPGTSRWRWLASDETTWMRCSDGCCEVH